MFSSQIPGCREATDIGPDEAILGFPYSDFEKITEYIEHLAKKAIPNSRSKKAFAMLFKKKEDVEKDIQI